METRDRIANLALLAASGIAWIVVAIILTTRDPYGDPMAGYVGALAIGAAIGLLATPLCWLVVFARHRRIAYRGDWVRAARRGGWIGLIVAIFIVLRLQSALELPIALFIVALVAVAEATLSAER